MVSAQDAVKTDPKHYMVASENDQVRILKVHYGPHEKSIMHSHPATVAVFLTDAKGQFSSPTGKRRLLP
jgi:quercetin dioxygenase-like cupin family protein